MQQPPKGADWVHEIKLDGWRLQLRVEDGSATIRTPKGLDYSHVFPALARDARGLDDCILDGEICAIDARGITDFAALQTAMKEGRTRELIYFAFDLLFIGRQDLRGHPLVDRQAKLEAFLDRHAPTGAIPSSGPSRCERPASVRAGLQDGLEGQDPALFISWTSERDSHHCKR